jgi:hypothetical protein
LKKGWWKELPSQMLNSLIVGGIAALATVGDWLAVGKIFGLTFLLEMRKFLDLNKRKS